MSKIIRLVGKNQQHLTYTYTKCIHARRLTHTHSQKRELKMFWPISQNLKEHQIVRVKGILAQAENFSAPSEVHIQKRARDKHN